jgi:hypothetical protein
MKKYKYITIDQHQGEMFEGRPVYRILNTKSGSQLGILSWYKPWKQYVFSSIPECVFNNSCLRDVLDFMEHHADPITYAKKIYD